MPAPAQAYRARGGKEDSTSEHNTLGNHIQNGGVEEVKENDGTAADITANHAYEVLEAERTDTQPTANQQKEAQRKDAKHKNKKKAISKKITAESDKAASITEPTSKEPTKEANGQAATKEATTQVAPHAISEANDQKTDVHKALVPVLPIESMTVSKMESEPVREDAGAEWPRWCRSI